MTTLYIVVNKSIKPLEKRLVISIAASQGIPADKIQFINYTTWTGMDTAEGISLLAMEVQYGPQSTILPKHKWLAHASKGTIFTCAALADVLDSPIRFFDLLHTVKKIAYFSTYKALADSVQPTEIIQAESSEEFVRIIQEGSENTELDCDIETRGFDFILDSILQLGICYAPGKSVTISNSIALQNPGPLRVLFNDPKYQFCWTNGKFDIKFLKYQWGCNARVDQDLYLLSYAEDERKGIHGLEYQAENILNITEYKGKIIFETVPENGPALIEYLGKDIAYQRLVRQFRNKELETSSDSLKLYQNILLPASETLARVEMNGIYVDIPYAQSLDVKYSKMLLERKDIIVDTAYDVGFDEEKYANFVGAKKIPDKFNPASPKQLSYLLIDVLQLPMYKKTRTTSEDALVYWLVNILGFPIRTIDEFEGVDDAISNEWLEVGSDREQDQKAIVYNLIYFRRFSKLHSTYITTVLEKHKNSRVHATFKLGGTVTGRLASEGPNLQNIPRRKEIKNMFSSAPDKTLIEVDYSQAELRVLAYLSQDPILIQTYMEDRDLHDAVATQIWGPNFTKEQRVGAKTINFGLAYGRGAASVAEMLNIATKDAKSLMEQWFNAMPAAGAWIKQARQAPYKQNPVTPFGRTRRFGLTTVKNANAHENEAVNFPIQSVASDLTLQAAMEIQKKLNLIYGHLPNAVRIVNIVHDAILTECNDELVPEVAKLIKTVMETLPARLLNTTIPFKADVEISKTGWGNKTKYKEEE